MRNYFLFCQIYNRIRCLRQTVVASIGRYFCSDTVFKLSSKILTDTQTNILEKGFDFAPIQNKNNEPEPRKDFEEICRRMRIMRYFCDDISEKISEKPAFTPKSKNTLTLKKKDVARSCRN